jgi:hypothetical protein
VLAEDDADMDVLVAGEIGYVAEKLELTGLAHGGLLAGNRDQGTGIREQGSGISC